MIHGVEVPLDSYRLAQYAGHVPCYVCDGPNAIDAELCRNCLAPMALAPPAGRRKSHPHMIAVMGSSGAGKTVYLGMLMDMLSRQPEQLQIVPQGAFSVNLQQMTTLALADGEFPEKTPNEPDRWNWVHCHVSSPRRRRGAELIIPDMSGEAILEEIDRPKTYPVVRSLLSRCSGGLLLIDAARLEEGRHEPEHFAMKVVTFLNEVAGDRKKGWPSRPISVVFSKADQTEAGFEDPAEFARRYMPGVWQYCQERLPKVAFFASGVAGACAYRTDSDGARRRIPLRIEPRGISEPFAWMLVCCGFSDNGRAGRVPAARS